MLEVGLAGRVTFGVVVAVVLVAAIVVVIVLEMGRVVVLGLGIAIVVALVVVLAVGLAVVVGLVVVKEDRVIRTAPFEASVDLVGNSERHELGVPEAQRWIIQSVTILAPTRPRRIPLDVMVELHVGMRVVAVASFLRVFEAGSDGHVDARLRRLEERLALWGPASLGWEVLALSHERVRVAISAGHNADWAAKFAATPGVTAMVRGTRQFGF